MAKPNKNVKVKKTSTKTPEKIVLRAKPASREGNSNFKRIMLCNILHFIT